MRIATTWTAETLSIDLTPEDDEPTPGGRGSLAGRMGTLRLPVPLTQQDVHPDVEALLGLLIAAPFSRSLTFARPVSQAFADAAGTALRKPVGPGDPATAARRLPTGGRIGLAFSGGADSSAALAVLPQGTPAVFLRRIPPPEGAPVTRYRDAAAMHACNELKARGHEVIVVEGDLEFIRRPVGFTTDWVNAAGAILLAEHLGLDGLCWGLIAESAYRLGYTRYDDWAQRQTTWGSVFAAAGLPMSNAVAGVSEVGTAAIVRASPNGDLSQSCTRGTPGESCQRCWKCFRKALLLSAHSGDWPSDSELDEMIRPAQVRKKLSHLPIKHEDVVTWAVGRYPGRNRVLRLIADRTRAAEQDLGWLLRFYGPSLELVPASHRDTVREGLSAYLAPMSADDERRMRGWDITAMLEDPRTAKIQRDLVRAIGDLAPRRPSLPVRLTRRARRLLTR